MEAIQKLGKVSDEDKLHRVVQVLDEDQDGVINIHDAIKVRIVEEKSLANLATCSMGNKQFVLPYFQHLILLTVNLTVVLQAAVTLVSLLSKTLNHCFVLRFALKAVGPMCCVTHVKEPSVLIEKEKGFAPVFLVVAAECAHSTL